VKPSWKGENRRESVSQQRPRELASTRRALAGTDPEQYKIRSPEDEHQSIPRDRRGQEHRGALRWRDTAMSKEMSSR
jgi:hypothetical protein